MGEVTLTVPAVHREAFLQAARIEVERCGDWVAENAGALRRVDTDDPSVAVARTEDLDDSLRHLAAQRAVWEAIDAGSEDNADVTGDPEAFAGIAETMARYVVAERITDIADVCPLDDEQAEKLIGLADGLEWAAKTACAMHRERVAVTA